MITGRVWVCTPKSRANLGSNLNCNKKIFFLNFNHIYIFILFNYIRNIQKIFIFILDYKNYNICILRNFF